MRSGWVVGRGWTETVERALDAARRAHGIVAAFSAFPTAGRPPRCMQGHAVPFLDTSLCNCTSTVLYRYEHLMSDVSDRLLLQEECNFIRYVRDVNHLFFGASFPFIRSPSQWLHVAPGALTRVRHVVRYGTTPSGHRKALRLAIACRVLFGGAQGFGKGGSRAGG